MQGPTAGLSQRPGEAEGSLTPGAAGEGGSSPDNDVTRRDLVGIAARQAVGGVAEQDLEGAFRGAVAQLLERRPLEARPGEALVEEHELVGDQQAARAASSRSPATWLWIVCCSRWRSEDTLA